VTFARVVPFPLFAGLAAHRFDRIWVLIASDGVRALVIAALAVAILLDQVAFWQIVVVAFVEGAGAAFFLPAAGAALRSIVPTTQLPAAAGAQQVRVAAVSIAGPPLGGALFGLGRAVPFLVDAVSYTFSIVSLLLMRTPFQEPRAVERIGLRARLAEGFRFVWRQPFVRTTTFLYGLSNFIGPGVLLVVVVVGHRQRLTGGEIGLLLAAFGACVLAGSLASPAVPPRALGPSNPPAGAMDVGRLDRLRRLAGRLRPDRVAPADSGRHPGDGLGRDRLPPRHHAGPPRGPGGERPQHDRAARRLARAADRRRAREPRVAAGDDRRVRRTRARARCLGHAQPGDP
jgi:MFS family permease